MAHTAQNEHPDRVWVLDIDDSTASEAALMAVVCGWPGGEPRLALRDGNVWVPRLTRSTALIPPPDAPSWALGSTGGGI